MENTTSLRSDAMSALLAQRAEAGRVDLIGRYLNVLQESMFLNRAETRPSMLKQIADDEAKALLGFLKQPAYSVIDHGSRLHQIGLSERTVLRLGHATRLFFLAHLDGSQIIPMLETVHAYQEGVLQGYIQGFEQHHLKELERLRNTLQRGES